MAWSDQETRYYVYEGRTKDQHKDDGSLHDVGFQLQGPRVIAYTWLITTVVYVCSVRICIVLPLPK